ncbi:MAG TPA: hypothetical protein VLL52_19905 [Anaerolineae bacterium]|nr:hypothetical protein [Anaerolineae bacterium]
MKNWINKRCFNALLICAMLVLILARTQLVEAQSEPGFTVDVIALNDLDGDGQLDQAVLQCACVTQNDQIWVMDGGGDMVDTGDWRSTVDMDNDIWLYDIGRDGQMNLIIVFETDEFGQRARLYDDVTGDGLVAYEIDELKVIVRESSYESMIVLAEPTWLLPNGQLNPNISGTINKVLPESFEFLNPTLAERFMIHDREPDISFELRDNDQDGILDYFLTRLLNDIPDGFAIGRSRLWVNKGTNQFTVPTELTLLWPYLSMGSQERDVDARFLSQIPLIEMDWENSQIKSWKLHGYPIEEGYWLNNSLPIELNESNTTSYEAPHAWYDLANNDNNVPELNVRLFTFPVGIFKQPWQEIRYSWNLFEVDKMSWDFKLGLVDLHSIEETISFADFQLKMPSYERLPYWTTERDWRLSTFVAREQAQIISSEGIYYWTPWAGVDPTVPENPGQEVLRTTVAYLNGADQSPADYFNDIAVGYRGEFKFATPSEPYMYISPIDGRLHLLYAEKGVMNLGDDWYVLYDNVDMDGYFDYWGLAQSGNVRMELFLIDNLLIQANEDNVRLKFIPELPTPQLLLPPRNHVEWQEAYDLLSKPMISSTANLPAMFDQFVGPTSVISNSSLSDLRITDNGFRFILTVTDISTVSGDDLPFDRILPGSYLISYDNNNGFASLEGLTPYELDIDLSNQEQLTVTDNTALLQVTAINYGLMDANDITLTVSTMTEDGEVVIGEELIDVYHEQPTQKLLSWSQEDLGAISLWIRLYDSAENILVQQEKRIMLVNENSVEVGEVMELISTPVRYGLLILLIIFVVLTNWIVSRQLWIGEV